MAKALDELSPADREVSKAFAGLGIVFDTLKLVASEYNAHALTTYFGKGTLPSSSFVVSTLQPNVCSPSLFHLSSIVPCDLRLTHLRTLWFCMVALALIPVAWFIWM